MRSLEWPSANVSLLREIRTQRREDRHVHTEHCETPVAAPTPSQGEGPEKKPPWDT